MDVWRRDNEWERPTWDKQTSGREVLGEANFTHGFLTHVKTKMQGSVKRLRLVLNKPRFSY
jgi:hypothetical protein